MTDTPKGTSDGKLCAKCAAPFGPDDDKRYALCANCRVTAAPEPAVPAQEHFPFEPEPVFIDVEKHAPPPIEDRDFYWCGTTRDCPCSITLGGFEFPVSIGRLVETGDGNQRVEADYAAGAVLPLTEENVALIKQHAANKVIRDWRVEEMKLLSGKTKIRYHGRLLSITGSNRRKYVPREGDKALGQFVYMVKVRHAADRPMDKPPTMVPRDW